MSGEKCSTLPIEVRRLNPEIFGVFSSPIGLLIFACTHNFLCDSTAKTASNLRYMHSLNVSKTKKAGKALMDTEKNVSTCSDFCLKL